MTVTMLWSNPALWMWPIGTFPTLNSLWVENLNGQHEDAPIYPWGEGSSNYGITVYAEEWGNSNGSNAYAEVGDVTHHKWFSTNSFQNGANWGFANESADEIVEHTGGGDFAKFSTQTFDGIAVYEAKTFQSWDRMDNRWHDWFKTVGSCSGNYIATVSSIFTDNNYSPNDDNSISWAYYC